MLEPARWRRRLARPVALRDGTVLRTLADMRAVILDQPEHIQLRSAWQGAARRAIEAAEGSDIEAATKQIELALFIEGRLKL